MDNRKFEDKTDRDQSNKENDLQRQIDKSAADIRAHKARKLQGE